MKLQLIARTMAFCVLAMTLAGLGTTPQATAQPLDTRGVIYALTADGKLLWYRHLGHKEGLGLPDPRAWAGGGQVGDKLQGLRLFVAGGEGFLYAVSDEGKLLGYRHRGVTTGAAGLEGPFELATGWGQVKHIAYAGAGVLYAVTPDGKLLWHRHSGFRQGAPVQGPDAWEGPKQVGAGWETFTRVFCGTGGVVYAINPNRDLQWRRFSRFFDGQASASDKPWEGGQNVGVGWTFKHVFYGGDSVLYAIDDKANLRWYRHAGEHQGTGLGTAGAWVGGQVIGLGWTFPHVSSPAIEGESITATPEPLAANDPASDPQIAPHNAPKLVTWSYYRQHNPELIVHALRQVQLGRRPASDLDGLDTPSRIGALLQQRWVPDEDPIELTPNPNAVPADNPAPGSKIDPAIRIQKGPSITNPAGTPKVTKTGKLTQPNQGLGESAPQPMKVRDTTPAPLTADLINKSAIQANISLLNPKRRSWSDLIAKTDPAQTIAASVPVPLDLPRKDMPLGSFYVGEARIGRIGFIAPVDGLVTVTLPKDSRLTVQRIYIDKGEFSLSALKPVSFKAAADAEAQEAPVSKPPTSGLFARVADGDLRYTRELTEVTQAPFELKVKAGQEVGITLRFFASRKDPLPEGPYQEELTIACRNFTAKVLAKGKCLGLKDGIDFELEAWDIFGLPESDVDIGIKLTNQGLPSEFKIEAIEMPQGVTLEPFNPIRLERKESRHAWLSFRLKSNSSTGSFAKDIRLRFINGERSGEFIIPCTVVPSWLSFTTILTHGTRSNANGVAIPRYSLHGEMQVRMDGTVRWYGDVRTPDHPGVDRWKAWVQFRNGEKIQSGGSIWHKAEHSQRFDDIFITPQVKTMYKQLAVHGRLLFTFGATFDNSIW